MTNTISNYQTWLPNLQFNEFQKRAIHRQMILSAASARQVVIINITNSVYSLSYENKSILFYDHMPDSTSYVARLITNSKTAAKTFLQRANLPIPEGRAFAHHERSSALKYASTLGYPVVLKSTTGSFGKNVYPSLANEQDFVWGWNNIPTKARIIVEKHIPGKDYRILAMKTGSVFAVERLPAFIIGDGCCSISQLINNKNEIRKNNPYLSSKLITLSPTAERNIRASGFTVDTVIPVHRNLTLNAVANVAAGGDSVDVTDSVHPAFKEVALRACNAVPGVFHVGVDVLAEDITKHPDDQVYAICEINTRPDIALHHFPVEGTPRDAAGALLEGLLPGSSAVPKQKWNQMDVRWDRRLDEDEVSDIKHLCAINYLTGALHIEKPNSTGIIFGTESALSRFTNSIHSMRGYITNSITKAAKTAPDKFSVHM